MANPDILFRGIPRRRTRGYTAQVLARIKPSVVVIPCAGSFSLAMVAREAGMLAEKIICGDISLYSTVLGYALMGRDLPLEPKGEAARIVAPYLTDPISKAAGVFFMLRLLQYQFKARTGKQHFQDRVRELVTSADEYVGQLKTQIEGMCEKLQGLRYHARDMWETLEQHRNNPDVVLLVNPPRYTGGYDRMFQGGDDAFAWDAPSVSQFIEGDYVRLMELLGRSEALTLMYYATPQEDPSSLWGEPWRSVFADRPGNKRTAAINWIIANRSPIGHAIVRARVNKRRGPYPLLNGKIEPGSDLRAKMVSREVGDYYRDLFIHQLPGSDVRRFVVLLLDGKLLGVLGLSMKNYMRGGGGGNRTNEPVYLVFAFTSPNAYYKRLHKLTLLSVVSRWFYDDVFSTESWYQLLGPPDAVQSTMLTRHPENKTARGIMKMKTRQRQPDGGYKLSYYGEIVDRSSEETLRLWLDRYGKLTK